MSSLGDFLSAMVELRKNKAQVAEYNASQQMAGMEALGKGIGGFLGDLGQGMQTGRQDALANQLYNRQNPPRAMAVNAALQGPADIAATQMPGGPLNAGGPFTGGVAGMKIQDLLDKSDIARERLANQQQLNEARIGQIGSMVDVRQTDADRKAAELALKQEREVRIAREKQIKDQQDEVNAAIKLEGQATDKYRNLKKDVNAWNAGYRPLMSAAAGAKTTEDYDKAVQGITAHYQVGVNMGFKEIAYPEIPTPAFMRNTGAADELQQMQARQNMITPGSMMRNWGLPGIPTDAAIAAKQKEAAAASYMPQLQEWNLAPQPTEPGPVTDYLPGGAAYPGGPGSPQTTPLGPSAQQQGPAPSAAAPGGGGGAITIPEATAQRYNPALRSGDSFTSKAKTYYVQ
jgi:hypothetical protein